MQDAGVHTLYTKHPEVAAALRRLYAAVRVKPTPDDVRRWLDLCYPQFEERAIAEATGGGVATLSDDVYKHLAWHAMCWDSTTRETVWYFLPRMLEYWAWLGTIAPAGPEPVDAVPPGMLAKILADSRLDEWPENVRKPTEDLLLAVCRHGGSNPFVSSLFELLIPLFGVGRLREEWERWEFLERARILAAVVRDVGGTSGKRSEWWSRLWGDWGVSADDRTAARRWLLEDESLRLLQNAFFATRDEGDRRLLSEAEQMLTFLRAGEEVE